MKPSFNKTLFTVLCLAAVLPAGRPQAAEPRSIIREPYDQDPRAITRPATRADREWRRTRRAPRLGDGPAVRVAPRPDAPRYDGRGRRLNVPGRPDTYDAIGQARRYRPRPTPSYSGPTVQTDVGTRINQLNRR